MRTNSRRIRRAGVLGIAACVLLVTCGKSKPGPEAPWLSALTRETHDPQFPLVSGAHANADCNACHGDFDTFGQYTCISCHEHDSSTVDPLHAGKVAGYWYGPASCYECHPRGDASNIDHSKIFPIEAGTTHAGAACKQCHIDPTQRTRIDCSACHPPSATDPTHTNVGGYATSGDLCIRCHGDSQVNPVAQHLPFGITSNYKHHLTSCLGCHPAMRMDKAFAADFSTGQLSCSACHAKSHMDDTHQGMSIYNYNDVTTCLSAGCHQRGTKP